MLEDPTPSARQLEGVAFVGLSGKLVEGVKLIELEFGN
jgi:hypothetical protein